MHDETYLSKKIDSQELEVCELACKKIDLRPLVKVAANDKPYSQKSTEHYFQQARQAEKHQGCCYMSLKKLKKQVAAWTVDGRRILVNRRLLIPTKMSSSASEIDSEKPACNINSKFRGGIANFRQLKARDINLHN